MFRKISIGIGVKLTLILVGFSVLIISLISVLFYINFDRALRERVWLQLSSVRQLKVVRVENDLKEVIREFEDEERIISGTFYRKLPQKYHVSDVERAISLKDVSDFQTDKVIAVAVINDVDTGYYVSERRLPHVEEIVLERTGLGETGESYIIGEDFKMLTESLFHPNDFRGIEVKSVGALKALKGKTGTGLFNDYRGVEVFSAYSPIQVNGLSWGLLSEIDHSEALFPLQRVRTTLLVLLSLILLGTILLAIVLSNSIIRPITKIKSTLLDMSQGVLSQVVDVGRKDEIGEMIRALNTLMDGLVAKTNFAEKIGEGVFEKADLPSSNQDELARALLKMRESLMEFRKNEREVSMVARQSLVEGEEAERIRVSKELHDGIGPLLTTIRLKLQSSGLDMKEKTSMVEMIDATIHEVRRVSNNLAPSVLDDFGVGEAVKNLVAQFKSPETSITYIDSTNHSVLPSKQIQIALYRIAQETITNAIRHAKASKIRLSLTQFEDRICYFSSDNGVGFDPSKVTGNGIRNMKERVDLNNGQFILFSDSSGTTFEIEIPL